MSAEKIFIGFDGGGTKISVCAKNFKGETVYSGRLEASGNISTAGGSKTAGNFMSVIKKSIGPPENIAAVTAAVAGFSNEAERGLFSGLLREELPAGTPLFIMPDYEIFFCCRWNDFSPVVEDDPETRIIAIAGTGSVIFGRARDERGRPLESRAFGYGPLISDPGSSFDLGQRFARNFLVEKETGKAAPEVFEIIKKHGLADTKTPSGLAFDANRFQSSLAAFAPAMIDAAITLPDSVYFRGVCDAARDLAAGISAVAGKLNSSGGRSCSRLLFNGGLILNSKFYREIVLKKIAGQGLAAFEFYDAPSDVSGICASYSIKKYGGNGSGKIKGDV